MVSDKADAKLKKLNYPRKQSTLYKQKKGAKPIVTVGGEYNGRIISQSNYWLP